MILVAATRILNEDDIVEAFVRHHHAMFDHHVFLDNGSHDRSCDILRALKDEGLPLTLLRVRSVSAEEASHLTWLHRYAAGALGADWVVHLDADEFIDDRTAGQSLRARLRQIPDDVHALRLRAVHYPNVVAEDAQERIVPRRLVWRLAEEDRNYKVAVRGRPLADRIVVDAGSHQAWLDDRLIEPAQQDAFRLAHYPRRSAWQQIAKFATGRLKVLAGGKAARGTGQGAHYTPLLEILRDRPQDLFHFPGFLNGSDQGAPLTRDPIAYAGGDLRHTQADDPQLKAVRSLASYAEELAMQHGRLIDENSAVRALLLHWVSEVQRVF